MRWKLFATLAEAAGTSELDAPVEATDPTLRDAFDALVEDRPALESEVVDDDGALYDHVRLLVDGEDPFRAAEGWDTDVADADELALFPPVSGG